MTMASTQSSDTRDSLVYQARQAALQDPAWAPFANMIDVEYDGQTLHYVLVDEDPDRIQAALDLEYGINDRPANSLLRRLPNG